MKLRFPPSSIQLYAQRYSYTGQETKLLEMRPSVQRAGLMTKQQLRLLAKWKSPRSAGLVESNSEAYIREVTAFALRASEDRSRIESLTLLDGVSWPTASVVLHMFHRDPYPILDFRALWSVQTDVPSQYTFEFWKVYVDFCRAVAHRVSIPMRVLDRLTERYGSTQKRTSRRIRCGTPDICSIGVCSFV